MLVVFTVTTTFASSVASTLTPLGEVPWAVATFSKLLLTVERVQLQVFEACEASVPTLLSQPGEAGSVTCTLCSVTSPVFVTLIVKCAVP